MSSVQSPDISHDIFLQSNELDGNISSQKKWIVRNAWISNFVGKKLISIVYPYVIFICMNISTLTAIQGVWEYQINKIK